MCSSNQTNFWTSIKVYALMFFLHPSAQLWSASSLQCFHQDCSHLSVLLNQGLNILKAWISKTHICSRLILPSKPHGMLNLKPLFRPITVNLKCFADLEHYNFREDMSSAHSDTKISLKTDKEVQAISSTQQVGWIGSARGCIPGITPGSWAFPEWCRQQLWRWGILRQEGSIPPATFTVPLCWAGIRGLTPSQHADFHNSEL